MGDQHAGTTRPTQKNQNEPNAHLNVHVCALVAELVAAGEEEVEGLVEAEVKRSVEVALDELLNLQLGLYAYCGGCRRTRGIKFSLCIACV